METAHYTKMPICDICKIFLYGKLKKVLQKAVLKTENRSQECMSMRTTGRMSFWTVGRRL